MGINEITAQSSVLLTPEVPMKRLTDQRPRALLASPQPISPARLLIVLEGIHDIEFLKRLHEWPDAKFVSIRVTNIHS